MQGGSSNNYYHDRQRSHSESRSSHASHRPPSTHHHHSRRDDRSPKENSYDNRRSYPLPHLNSRDYRRDSRWDSSHRMSHNTSSPRHLHQRRRKAPSEQVVVHTAPLSSNKILQLAKQSLAKSNSDRLARPTEPLDSTNSSSSSNTSAENQSDSKGVKRPQTDEILSSPPKIPKPTENASPRPKIEIRKDIHKGSQNVRSRLSLMKNTARAEKEIRQQDEVSDATKNGSSRVDAEVPKTETKVKVDKVEEVKKKKSSSVDDKEKKKKDKLITSEKKRHSKSASAEEAGSSEDLEVIGNVSTKVIPAVIVKNMADRNSRDSSPEVL